jgi:hypothetical protein
VAPERARLAGRAAHPAAAIVSAPDVAGIYKMLANLPKQAPERRQAYRRAASTHRVAASMSAGRRYRTRSLPRSPGAMPRWHVQPRDELGRWKRAS